jgi:hypothetical protein
VQFEAVPNLSLLEVPHQNFCDLPREGVFSTGDVFAVSGDLDG